MSVGLDVISLGRRVRHLRKQAGLTLDDLSAAVGTAPSQLSLIGNGKREPNSPSSSTWPGHSTSARSCPGLCNSILQGRQVDLTKSSLIDGAVE
ncbi:hypothetical protein AYX22_22210 (plasmid) [Arthrobacter sp. D5-1]|nr:hypothetical protein AYX22_22210 [Arthrobacter sp. D5-1]